MNDFLAGVMFVGGAMVIVLIIGLLSLFAEVIKDMLHDASTNRRIAR